MGLENKGSKLVQIRFYPVEDFPVVPAVVTEIHDGGEAVVTSVLAGVTVHDEVTVSGSNGTPTGTVSFLRYDNDDCEGLYVIESVGILSGGTVESTGYATDGEDVAEGISYRAWYSGDVAYYAQYGDCEPLTVLAVPE